MDISYYKHSGIYDKYFNKAVMQPNLPMLGYNIPNLLDYIENKYFHEIGFNMSLYFIDSGPLACITKNNNKQAIIYIHQVLNHGDVPIQVIELIILHEYCHLIIEGKEENGKYTSHPKDFWEFEKSLYNERNHVWLWIDINLKSCIKRDETHECILIKNRKWKSVYGNYECDYDKIKEIKDSFERYFL